MAVVEGMFLFEVVVESIQCFVECKQLVIKSDFADIFSLELIDPKQLNIVMPEPLPLPPDPPGKKGKKPKPKPKPKGKKGAVVAPPPEPVIQSGQSVLFACSAEFLIQNMRKCCLELSVWDKEDRLVYIGSNTIPWDEVYLVYLTKIANCMDPEPVFVKDDYNIFEEGTAKLVAKLGIQIKLTFLKDKVVSAFRSLSEDPSIRKYLYTGLNSKITSYMCTMKTTDEIFIENSNKIENNFVEDIEKPGAPAIQYASYKNAPGANLTTFSDGDYCCIFNADKPPESIYKAYETLPDIDQIIDYVRKIIVSCNDNMRMLTPSTKIVPRVKATDIDRLCYCTQTGWPDSDLAKKMKRDVQSGPCPLCIDAGKKREGSRGATFNIANIRGPCGKPDCRIARDLRDYIERIVEEDNKVIDLNDVVGPCGSKSCTLAEKIQEFLRHEGVFTQGNTLEGLSTQCGCLQQMHEALTEKKIDCNSECSKDCVNISNSEDSICEGKACPAKVYNVYYFTVEYNTNASTPRSSAPTSKPASEKTSKHTFCASDCPSVKASEIVSCSKSVCTSKKSDTNSEISKYTKCDDFECPDMKLNKSPADSDIVLDFDKIHNPCCVKTCDVAEKVKDFIVDGLESKHKKTTLEDDPCFCDCVCDFNFTHKTTHCPVCGGYEAMGDDLRDAPPYAKPYPCPVYHKMYNKKYLKTKSPWSEENEEEKPPEPTSKKSTKQVQKDTEKKVAVATKEDTKKVEKKKVDKEQATTGKEKKVEDLFDFGDSTQSPPAEKKPVSQKYTVPFVPKDMGWLWTAEDIPGMKFRPFWRPGAANKILVRRYRAQQGAVDIMAKKKRAMLQRKKKLEMKPTLIVKKTNGEYTVQMEVFKKYSKERLLFQYPYDEKPPQIYTVGRTEEENERLNNKRERRGRRETRRKCKYLQSAFRDRCQEICLKAYNQAIGVLPPPKPNDPTCPCDADALYNPSPQIDSCSCSDVDDIESSDSDGDDWVIEFTPPAARWDAKAKHPPVMTDNETHYTYLDYKVKLLDKSGNPVPRFFKGQDGKQECSDLGGFWGPGHFWLEINKDGYIGPDNRWIPMNFIGPDGMFYTADDGFITDSNGQVLRLGIDGYIDKDGKWAWYSKQTKLKATTSAATNKKDNTVTNKIKAVDTKSIKEQPKKGSKEPILKNKPVKNAPLPKPSPPAKVSKAVSYSSNPLKTNKKPPVVMSATVFSQNRLQAIPSPSHRYDGARRLAKCKEILGDSEVYDSIPDFRSILKYNAASYTSRKKFSPFTMI